MPTGISTSDVSVCDKEDIRCHRLWQRRHQMSPSVKKKTSDVSVCDKEDIRCLRLWQRRHQMFASVTKEDIRCLRLWQKKTSDVCVCNKRRHQMSPSVTKKTSDVSICDKENIRCLRLCQKKTLHRCPTCQGPNVSIARSKTDLWVTSVLEWWHEANTLTKPFHRKESSYLDWNSFSVVFSVVSAAFESVDVSVSCMQAFNFSVIVTIS